MKKQAIYFFGFLIVLCNLLVNSASAQKNNPEDSLSNAFTNAPNDSLKVMTLAGLFDIYQREFRLKECKETAKKALEISAKNNIRSIIGVSNLLMGITYKETEEYPLSQNHLSIALLKLHPVENKRLLSDAYSYMGFIQEQMGLYEKAISYHRKSLQIRSEINEKITGVSMMRMAGCFSILKMQDSAFHYFYKSMAIAQKYQLRNLAGVYNNLGIAYDNINKDDSALVYYKKALEIHTTAGDSVAMAGTLINIGSVYQEQKKFDNAIPLFKQGIDIATKVKYKMWIANGSANLADIYYQIKEYRSAYDHLKIAKQFADSVLNEGKLSEIANAEEKYQSEKKQQELEIADLKIRSQEDKLHSGERVRNILIGAIIIMLLAGLFVFYAYHQKKKLFRQLSAKNKEVEFQKAIIEEKNKNITDSIEYAKRIQRSHLPNDYSMHKNLERLKKKIS